MRKLVVDTSEDPVTLDILQALQLRTVNDPWLPRLKRFECKGATEMFVPFIPSFLSPKTTEINIVFAKDPPMVVVATMISRLSSLCLNLEWIVLRDLPRDPVVTEAVSEMLLACNRDALQVFCVDSPLAEEAQKVVCRLPRLFHLWVVVQGPTSLPTVALPNLTVMDIEYDNDLNWLQGFRGAVLEELESVTFHTESDHIGDFIGAFESVALTTSVQDTLSVFRFYTSRPWNPNYSSLLSFNQLKQVEIDFSCGGGCSSRIDDGTIVSLGRAMPKLEVLQLGGTPCKTPTGITVEGLIGLACLCPHLSELRIHFQATSLVEAATRAAVLIPSNEPVVQRKDCVLVDLEVGETPIPARSGLTVALMLLQIFPRMLNVKYKNREWKTVAETVRDFRRFGGFVHQSSKAHLPLVVFNDRPPVTPYQETQSITKVPVGRLWGGRARYHLRNIDTLDSLLEKCHVDRR